jgi:hypothetical protein
MARAAKTPARLSSTSMNNAAVGRGRNNKTPPAKAGFCGENHDFYRQAPV